MNADSIKAKLKNKSQAAGKTLQELLVAYGLESPIKDNAFCCRVKKL
jgi:hypothetical protein